MRSPKPFTSKQVKLLKALNDKLSEIDDPNKEIITHEEYSWQIKQTKQFGKIPKIRFSPHSCQIKAEIIRSSGLIDDTRENQLSEIRRKYGVKNIRHTQARRFEAEISNIMLKIKKAVYTVGYINHLFSFETPIATPLALLQEIVIEEQERDLKPSKCALTPKTT